LHNLGRALVDQRDQEVLGTRILAPALRKRRGAALSLHMQINSALTGAASGRDNIADRPPVTRLEGSRSGPVTFGDAHQDMDRAAAAPELVRELEAQAHRLHVGAAQLIAVHHTSMACDVALEPAAR
jgi:hypothetical protein